MTLLHLFSHKLRLFVAVSLALVFALGSTLASAAEDALVVGIDPASPPFETQKDGEVVGFDVDLIHAIAKAEDLPITIRVLPFSGIIPSLQSGSIDLAINGITVTRDRMQNVLFSHAYYLSGLSLLVKEGSDIDDFDDLKGRVVAIRKGTSAVDYLKKHGMYDKVHLKQYGSIDSAYQAVMTGGADAALYDHPMNVGFTLAHKGAKVAGDLLTGEYYSIAVSPKRPELVKALNAGLEKIKANGEYQALFDTYLGGDTHGMIKGVKSPEDVAISN